MEQVAKGEQDVVATALSLCQKTDKGLMKEAIEEVFGTLDVQNEHLSQLAHAVVEKYEELSLA